MAVTNLGRPRSGVVRDMELISIPIPRSRKQALEDEARAAGCRSMAQFIRQKLEWDDANWRGKRESQA